jgi:hypothetical protein
MVRMNSAQTGHFPMQQMPSCRTASSAKPWQSHAQRCLHALIACAPCATPPCGTPSGARRGSAPSGGRNGTRCSRAAHVRLFRRGDRCRCSCGNSGSLRLPSVTALQMLCAVLHLHPAVGALHTADIPVPEIPVFWIGVTIAVTDMRASGRTHASVASHGLFLLSLWCSAVIISRHGARRRTFRRRTLDILKLFCFAIYST